MFLILILTSLSMSMMMMVNYDNTIIYYYTLSCSLLFDLFIIVKVEANVKCIKCEIWVWACRFNNNCYLSYLKMWILSAIDEIFLMAAIATLNDWYLYITRTVHQKNEKLNKLLSTFWLIISYFFYIETYKFILATYHNLRPLTATIWEI